MEFCAVLVGQVRLELNHIYTEKPFSTAAGNMLKKQYDPNMKRVILLSILLAVLWCPLPSAAEALRVYDRDWNLRGYVKDGRVYDQNWKPQGQITGDRVCDEDWKLRCRIEGDRIYDRNWEPEACIKDGKIYDRGWERRGHIERGR